MNLWLKSFLFNSSQFVEKPPVEHRNVTEILTQENSAWFATRLHFRASFILLYINDLQLNIQGVQLVLFTYFLLTKIMMFFIKKICYERIRVMVS